ncbi:uncharacterized protein B4U79_16215 [Dinothrombium tinctorium]|uniref:Fibronectin type-III domain-containing protein n=1 Tax=Dinothrombium tinctorium TaxID=1965070 RepID=A0A3S3P824_9ACAR|nr:uncharacterized protein B4U79_16215 [Dinothrombium tinctorium]
MTMYAICSLFFVTTFALNARPVGTCVYGQEYGVMNRDLNVLFGNNFTLNCTLTVDEAPINGSLYRLNSSLIYFKHMDETLNKTRLYDNRTALVTVKNSTFNNSGNYFCYVRLPTDSDMFVCNTNIIVGIAPKAIDDSKFKCVSMHFRNLTCVWQPPYTGVDTTYNLSLYPYGPPTHETMCAVKLNQTACQWRIDTLPPYRLSPRQLIFKLKASNVFGHIEKYFFIDHYDIVVPLSPQEFSLEDVSTTTISLKWDHPPYIEHDFTARKFLKYEIQFRPIPNHRKSPPPYTIINIGNTLDYTLIDLIPFTKYEIKLRCRMSNLSSSEKWSNFVQLTTSTKKDVPYISPKFTLGAYEISEMNYTHRKIKIYWSPVSEEHYNAPEFYYLLYFYTPNKHSSTVHEVRVDPSHWTYSLPLRNTDMYQFKIYSVNSEGHSSEFSTLVVDSQPRLPEKPRDVAVFYYGNMRYEVRWSGESNSHSVASYTVFWCSNLHRSGCREPLSSKLVPASTQPAVLLNVTNDSTAYMFAVSANTHKNTSSGLTWTACIISHFGDSLPPITEFSVEPTGFSTAQVKWKLPCPSAESVFESFEIYYCEWNENVCVNQDKNLIVEGGRTNSALIEDLEPLKVYRFFMYGRAERIQSYPTRSALIKTYPGPPTAPKNVRCIQVTDKSIQLAWQADGNQTLHFFRIELNDEIAYDFDVSTINNSTTDLYTLTSNSSDEVSDARLETNQLFCSSENGILNCSLDMKNSVESYAEYKINVSSCVNSKEEGKAKILCSSDNNNSVNVKTKISYPSKMEKLNAEVLNKTTLLLSWRKPYPANGPINGFKLHMYKNENRNISQVIELSDNITHYKFEFGCGVESPTSFRIQAFNLDENKVALLGPLSDETFVNGCIDSPNAFLIIGLTAGCALVLIILLFTLIAIIKWALKKYEDWKNWKIVLPEGLIPFYREPPDHPMKHFMQSEDDLNKPDGVIIDSEYKDRHHSGNSEMTECSTDGLIPSINQKSHKFKRTYSDQSNPETGHESVSSGSTCATQVSSDSGAVEDRHDFMSFSSSDSKDRTRDQKQVKSLPSVDEKKNGDSGGSNDSGLDVSSNNSAGRILHKNQKNRLTTPTKDMVVYKNQSLSNSEPSLYEFIPNEVIESKPVGGSAKHARSAVNIFDYLPGEALRVNFATIDNNKQIDENGRNFKLQRQQPLALFTKNGQKKSFPIRDNYVTPEMMKLMSSQQMSAKPTDSTGSSVEKNELIPEIEETNCDLKHTNTAVESLLENEMTTKNQSADFVPLDISLADNVNVFRHKNGVCIENKKDLSEDTNSVDPNSGLVIDFPDVESRIDATKEALLEPLVSFVNSKPQSRCSSIESLSSSSSSLHSVTSPLTHSKQTNIHPSSKNSDYVTHQDLLNFSQKSNTAKNTDVAESVNECDPLKDSLIEKQPQLIRNASGYVSFPTQQHHAVKSMPAFSEVDNNSIV